MAENYKINKKSQTISISGALTAAEKQIVELYMTQGYTIAQKRKAAGKADILKWFDKKKDADGKAAFEKDIETNGYLKARAAFAKKYAGAIKEINASIK